MTSATVSNETLFISGQSVTTYLGYRFEVRNNFGPFTVTDSDLYKTDIPISGDIAEIRNIDLSGLFGVGALVVFFHEGKTKITGSDQNDHLTGTGSGRKKLFGNGGDDLIASYDGNDILSGGNGDDKLSSGDGDDRLKGGRGDDYLQGGRGSDTLIFAGKAADYDIRVVNKLYQISHLDGNGFDGVDTFIEIEKLQFADQTFRINSVPTSMTAQVTHDTLFMSGRVADTNSYRAAIEHFPGSVFAFDNVYDWSNDTVVINIQGDISAIRDIDATGVIGKGVEISSDFDDVNILHGSNYSDLIRTHSSNDGDQLLGYRGQDRMFGGDGNDVIRGGNGKDYLSGGRGDDRIRGQRGSDEVDGGDGTDTLIFKGEKSEYEISVVGGRYEISHLEGTGYDDVDYFINVERLKFADQVVEITGFPTNLHAEIIGDTLFVSGSSAQSYQFNRVEITLYPPSSYISVLDNRGTEGDKSQSVPIIGNVEDVVNIDARAMTGAGVTAISSALVGTIWGSAQSDELHAGGSRKTVFKVYGLKGDDKIGGGGHDDLLVGGSGNDSISGWDGNDRILGQRGSDFINGGDGTDTMVFKGVKSEYKLIETGTQGGYEISHLDGLGFDGIDEFYNIEVLEFADQSLNTNDWGILS